jgi:hypothetical protein
VATRQIFTTSTYAGISPAPLFVSPISPTEVWESTSTQGQPWLTSANIRHFGINRYAGIGAGITLTYTILVNGIATDFTFSMTGSDTIKGITGCLLLNVNDRVILRRTVTGGSAPAGTDYITFVVDNQVANETSYGITDRTNLFVGLERVPIFGGDAFDSYLIPAANSVIPTPGNITIFRVVADSVLPAGVTQTFYIVKNGVAQNGGGGTPDTRIVITDAITVAQFVGTVACLAGDLVYLECTRTGGNPGTIPFGIGVKFTPTTDGHSWCGSSRDNYLPQVAGTVYSRPSSMTDDLWASIETNDTVFNNSPYSFDIKGIRWSLTPIFGVPSSMTWSVRVNGASPVGTPSATGTYSGTDAVSQITIAPSDYWNIRVVQTGTAGIGALAAWSFIQIATSDVGACGGGGTGSIRVVKVVDPITSEQEFQFTAGGGLTPTTFGLHHGDQILFSSLIAGTYSIVETVPPGYSVAYVVSDGSPNTAIVLGAGENVTVTVTNTFLSLSGSGIYYIKPDKTHDTIYVDVDIPTTTNVKKPDPTYRTALIGG